MNTSQRAGTGFLVAFGLVALLLAAVVSYFADPDPDGLEAVTQQGCTVVETTGGEQLEGRCIAQSGTEHALADSPLADYAVSGDEAWTGVAGVIGVLATLAVSFGLFWLLRRPGRSAEEG